MKQISLFGLLLVLGIVACEGTDDVANNTPELFGVNEEETIEVPSIETCEQAITLWNGGEGEITPGDPCTFEDKCIDEYGDQMRCVDGKFVVACGITDPTQEPTFLVDGGTCDDPGNAAD